MTLAERIAALSPAQRIRLAERLRARAANTPAARLVAYFTPAPGHEPTAADLRVHLERHLPEHMVPRHYQLLATMPRTANGKIDRQTLDGVVPPVVEHDHAVAAPRNAVEAALERIWAAVLGRPHVGIHSNFFELGGDSIVSLQVVSRARQEGLDLAPRQVFQHPTIAELAAAAGTAPIVAEQAQVHGPAQLLPIQHYFFDQRVPDVNHWNMALSIELRAPLDPTDLQRVLDHIQVHHDALRARCAQDDTGWVMHVTETAGPVPLTCFNLDAAAVAEQDELLERAVGLIQRTLDITRGPILHAAYFGFGEGRAPRLVLTAHHLVVDGVSWRVLLEDLESAYAQVRSGADIVLPSKTSSARAFAERLHTAVETGRFDAERDYWTALAGEPTTRLPRDHVTGSNVEASAERVATALTVDETRALLGEVPAAYQTRIDDVLRAAFVRTLCTWAGTETLCVDLEGHGREELFDDIDLSRSVGWFTCLYPAVLRHPKSTDPGDLLKSIKEQTRAIPNRGIGYGVLRYLARDPEVGRAPLPEVCINYLGQFDGVGGGAVVRRVDRIDLGVCHCPTAERTHVLEVNALVLDGQLLVEWTFSRNLHRLETITRLSADYLANLRMLIRHCQSADAGGFTPSDFPEAGLDQTELDRFIGRITEDS